MKRDRDERWALGAQFLELGYRRSAVARWIGVEARSPAFRRLPALQARPPAGLGLAYLATPEQIIRALRIKADGGTWVDVAESVRVIRHGHEEPLRDWPLWYQLRELVTKYARVDSELRDD